MTAHLKGTSSIVFISAEPPRRDPARPSSSSERGSTEAIGPSFSGPSAFVWGPVVTLAIVGLYALLLYAALRLLPEWFPPARPGEDTNPEGLLRITIQALNGLVSGGVCAAASRWVPGLRTTQLMLAAAASSLVLAALWGFGAHALNGATSVPEGMLLALLGYTALSVPCAWLGAHLGAWLRPSARPPIASSSQ